MPICTTTFPVTGLVVVFINRHQCIASLKIECLTLSITIGSEWYAVVSHQIYLSALFNSNQMKEYN